MKRYIIYLGVLTVLALLALVMFAPGDTATDEAAAARLLMPRIAERINDVNRVEIITAGTTTVATLVKTSEGWQLEQMGGYRADWSKLQGLLADLARARVIEQKTDKPEYYARLGVENIAGDNAGGVLVVLSLDGQATGIIIGNRASGRDGHYVRLEDAAASLMVNRSLDVPTNLQDWADSRIIDIDAAEVAEVEIIHPQGSRILVTKVSADDTDFVLEGLSPDREIKSSWAVNSLGSVLSMLDLESVRPAQDVDWSEAVRMRLLMFSGIEIMADMVQSGEDRLLRLKAGYPAGDVVNHVTAPEPATAETTPSATDEATGDDAGSIEQTAAEDVARMVDEINSRVDGWAYGIAGYKFEALVKQPEDLLKPVESP